MPLDRRSFLGTLGAGAVLGALPGFTHAKENTMYGLIGRMRATPGQRDALVSILLEGVSGMPGCLSYVVAEDPGDADALWITEVWDNADSHKASLALAPVKAAIAKAQPILAGFDTYTETRPVGGHGLRAAG